MTEGRESDDDDDDDDDDEIQGILFHACSFVRLLLFQMQTLVDVPQGRDPGVM